jgi:adenylate kinase
MRIVLLGPPGAGKGTQARHLADRFGLTTISTGDIFRWNIKEGTELGKLAKGYLDAGELVPDDVTTRIVMDAIDRTTGGFLLDGFPRTLGQAQALDDELATRDRPLSAALAFLVPDAVVVQRIAGRRTCADCQAAYNLYFAPPAKAGVCDRCGGALVQRSDQDEETVKRRLEVYRESTAPLLAYYADRSLLREVDAEASETEVTERALAVLSDLVPTEAQS